MDAPAATPDGDVLHYDLRGLKCPLPAMKTRRRLKDLSPGALIAVTTSDPLAIIDIPHLCREDGHLLVKQDALPDTPGQHRFLIRKGG
ncbi:sulfurtransferase TusA family protein [Xaviernesmea oryzae]|nr:sulfurtransferase TusA family protein [Xaviernesmea oryzae]